MSQRHLVLDFPIDSPADAKALAEDLPSLMPDFAKAQDDLGTVHFSRFMIKGDDKLLFISDIDGEVAPHIERLVQAAQPVLELIFKHVDNPPAVSISENDQRIAKWLKHHVKEPLDEYFAYEDASVQDVKAWAREANLVGTTAQSPSHLHEGQVATARFRPEAGCPVHPRRRSASVRCRGDLALFGLGALRGQSPRLLHHLRWLVRALHPGFRGQDRHGVRRGLSSRRRRPAHPRREERSGVLRVGLGSQLRAHRLLQCLPGFGVQDIRALRADHRS